MAAGSFDLPDLEKRMRGTVDSLKRELSGLRTGRASAHLLDPVQVTVYGAKMPLDPLTETPGAWREHVSATRVLGYQKP